MSEYVVIYERAGENFSAYVPDLPGCVACGDTIEETEDLIRDGIRLYLEALKEEGLPVPPSQTVAGVIAVA